MGKLISRLLVFLVVAIALAAGVQLLRTPRQQSSSDAVRSEEQTKKHTQKKHKHADFKHKAVTAGYYYSQLEDSERELYAEMLRHLEAQEDSFTVSETEEEVLDRVYRFVLYDRPELFWVSGAMQYTIYTGLRNDTEIHPQYNVSPAERQDRQKRIRTRVKKFLAKVPSDTGDYEKVKAVFDYLVDRVEYDTRAEDGQNICSAMLNRRSVCAGYARSAQLLLQELGIPCIYVPGVADGGAHAWNIVRVNGNYYNFDATFGDRSFSEKNADTLFDSRNKDYNYLLFSDEEAYRARRTDGVVRYPECRSIQDNYYVRNGCYFQKMDADALRALARRSADSGENYLSCKFSSKELYEQASDFLFHTVGSEQAEAYSRRTGQTTAHYASVKNDDMYEISIAWGA